MRIPEARDRLREIAKEYNDPRLFEIVNAMYRKPSVRPRAKPTAQTMTPVIRSRVRAFAESNPQMSNREIGRHFGVDGGRVSEVISGFRE